MSCAIIKTMSGIDASVFNIPSSLSELPQSSPVIGISFRKIIPRATATQGNFASGSINFSFSLGGNQSWIPSHSFIVQRHALYENDAILATTGDAAQPGATPNVEQLAAPSFLQPQCLYDGAQL